MKVLVDAHMLGLNEGGNERYIASLIQSLGRKVEICAIVGNSRKNVYGASKIIKVNCSNWIRYLYLIPKVMRDENCEVVLTTYFISPFVARKNIVMIHDLLPLRNPEYFNIRERLQFLLLKYSIYFARKIIVPSNFVKSEIAHFFPGFERKVRVIAEAANAIFKPVSRKERSKLRRKYNLDKVAVLVILSKYQKRPLEPIMEGLQLVGREMVVYLLNSSFEAIVNSNAKIEYRVIKGVKDEVLAELYSSVDLVIYGSRYEGFGLPILESLQSKTPLLTTKIAPAREILGDDYKYYFDLDKPLSLAHQIKKLLKESQQPNQTVLKQEAIVNNYSLMKTAGETYDLLHEMRNL